ncbi:response regulator [uncultured Sphingomonas sp.]|uniref:response regulator n=1 Tax=uncultured Sphingomonas sp. TaxID=158754 RepID=UPI0025D3A75F|nr:response regulator [uncultured Sphingomonas sp.]
MQTPTVLIVEDEMLVAIDLEASLEEHGYRPVGIAADMSRALELASTRPDVALVDCNLRDGPTGPTIGRMLGQTYGTTVIFLTANPAMLDEGIAGTLGVVSKPCGYESIGELVNFAVRARHGDLSQPPTGIKLFEASHGYRASA